MKKALIPIVALLTFSVLITSVSAPVPEYFVARFHGSASGCCWVFEDLPEEPLSPDASGKGRLRTSGSAIVRWDPGQNLYWANKLGDPNTCLWTRRTRMRVSWGSEKLMVYMWSSDEAGGSFNDTTDTFMLMMNFSGYYMKDSALKHISGFAFIQVGKLPTTAGEVLAAAVMLFIGAFDPTDHFRSFVWQGEETEILPPGCISRRIIHRVTVWPIEWHPTIY